MKTSLVALAALALLASACPLLQEKPAPTQAEPGAEAQADRPAAPAPTPPSTSAMETAAVPATSEPQASEPSPSAAPEREPLRVGGEVTRPVLLSKGPIDFDALNRRKNRKAGVVIVEAVIDETGKISNLRVLKGLDEDIDAAVTASLRAAKFKPATLAGKPVPVYYSLVTNIEVQ